MPRMVAGMIMLRRFSMESLRTVGWRFEGTRDSRVHAAIDPPYLQGFDLSWGTLGASPDRPIMLIGKNRFIRRRAVIGLLLAASLTLLTLSFRWGSDGVIGVIQRGALSITAPFSEATTRVTKPFVDAWNWAGGLVDARSENERLKKQLEEARAANLLMQQLQADIAKDRQLLHFTQTSALASQYGFVGATVIQQSNNAYNQTITLGVGSADGVSLNDPVVPPAGDSTYLAGLIGPVSSVTSHPCAVRLILDPVTAVPASPFG